MSKVLFVLMPQFKDVEFTTPFKIISDAEHTIDVAGLAEGTLEGADGHQHTPNLLFSDMTTQDFDKYDMIVIPGGPGSKTHLWNNESLHSAIKHFHELHKPIAAICYAVIAVVQTGILRNKHATVYPTDEAKGLLEEYGVRFSKDLCVALAPEKIITAQGPKAAEEFGKALLKFL